MKTLIEVDRAIWGKVKDFATIKKLSLNSALDYLLTTALNGIGYSIQKEERSKE
jgi:hypothetical protein